ncbi:hypothetical protein [Treponema sp. OMZ 305]|uniref:hypothetical protein n=1 Tax=Treponema sp. OMZ 305 TaxID=1659192 RepID=UPI0020A4BFC5|nr:hypothetical protein [Treponema sp. OMZ 305]
MSENETVEKKKQTLQDIDIPKYIRIANVIFIALSIIAAALNLVIDILTQGHATLKQLAYLLFNFRTKAVFFRGVTIYCSNDQFNQSNIRRIDCQPYRFFYRSTLSPSVRNVTKNGITQLARIKAAGAILIKAAPLYLGEQIPIQTSPGSATDG